MAIDTATKRLAALDDGLLVQPGLPVPDGTISAQDRAHLLWMYWPGASTSLINTQNKRRSVTGYLNYVIAPVADATIAAADREHMTRLYAGIAAAGGGGPTGHRKYNLLLGVG